MLYFLWPPNKQCVEVTFPLLSYLFSKSRTFQSYKYIYIDIYVEHSQINIYELVSVQVGIHTLALCFELSGLILQPGTGQEVPRALAVLWGPTLHPTEPPGLGQGQQLLQGEPWVLLEAKVLFQKGKWFKAEKLKVQLSQRRQAVPGGVRLSGRSPGAADPARWHSGDTRLRLHLQPQGISHQTLAAIETSPRYKTLPGWKHPDCQRNHFEAETGNGGVGLAVDLSGHLSPAIICLRKRVWQFPVFP